ncbi:MAG: hypothetical protein K0S08_550 [Gammaproteobacteria bacterium]|jgi:hypothetical protein|nr:hypothetical protein [Gammaproteobacteria bacterium]
MNQQQKECLMFFMFQCNWRPWSAATIDRLSGLFFVTNTGLLREIALAERCFSKDLPTPWGQTLPRSIKELLEKHNLDVLEATRPKKFLISQADVLLSEKQKVILQGMPISLAQPKYQELHLILSKFCKVKQHVITDFLIARLTQTKDNEGQAHSSDAPDLYKHLANAIHQLSDGNSLLEKITWARLKELRSSSLHASILKKVQAEAAKYPAEKNSNSYPINEFAINLINRLKKFYQAMLDTILQKLFAPQQLTSSLAESYACLRYSVAATEELGLGNQLRAYAIYGMAICLSRVNLLGPAIALFEILIVDESLDAALRKNIKDFSDELKKSEVTVTYQRAAPFYGAPWLPLSAPRDSSTFGDTSDQRIAPAKGSAFSRVHAGSVFQPATGPLCGSKRTHDDEPGDSSAAKRQEPPRDAFSIASLMNL